MMFQRLNLNEIRKRLKADSVEQEVSAKASDEGSPLIASECDTPSTCDSRKQSSADESMKNRDVHNFSGLLKTAAESDDNSHANEEFHTRPFPENDVQEDKRLQ